jgi:hypothetical protein
MTPQWPFWTTAAQGATARSDGAATRQPPADALPGQQGVGQVPQGRRSQSSVRLSTEQPPGSDGADVRASPWSQGQPGGSQLGGPQASPAGNSKLQAVWNVARLPLLPVMMPVMAVGWVAFRGAKLAQRTVVSTGKLVCADFVGSSPDHQVVAGIMVLVMKSRVPLLPLPHMAAMFGPHLFSVPDGPEIVLCLCVPAAVVGGRVIMGKPLTDGGPNGGGGVGTVAGGGGQEDVDALDVLDMPHAHEDDGDDMMSAGACWCPNHRGALCLPPAALQHPYGILCIPS